MSRCQICDEKAMNCDCTQSERDLHDECAGLYNEVANLQSRINQFDEWLKAETAKASWEEVIETFQRVNKAWEEAGVTDNE